MFIGLENNRWCSNADVDTGVVNRATRKITYRTTYPLGCRFGWIYKCAADLDDIWNMMNGTWGRAFTGGNFWGNRG